MGCIQFSSHCRWIRFGVCAQFPAFRSLVVNETHLELLYDDEILECSSVAVNWMNWPVFGVLKLNKWQVSACFRGPRYERDIVTHANTLVPMSFNIYNDETKTGLQWRLHFFEIRFKLSDLRRFITRLELNNVYVTVGLFIKRALISNTHMYNANPITMIQTTKKFASSTMGAIELPLLKKSGCCCGCRCWLEVLDWLINNAVPVM